RLRAATGPCGATGAPARGGGGGAVGLGWAGARGGPPLRVSLPQASAWAGVYAAAGSLLALHHRYLTGEGQHVDVAAQSCLLSALGHAPGFWDLNRTNAVRAGVFMTGRSITGARMRVMWPCRDGFLNF